MHIDNDAMRVGSRDLRGGIEIVVGNRDVFASVVGLLKK